MVKDLISRVSFKIYFFIKLVLWDLSTKLSLIEYNDAEILSVCDGPKTGVFVSGPEKMRRDVAAICSSDGLHYQSFSFNW